MMIHSLSGGGKVKAAVIGAGVMGASIAGHLANVGIQTLLLDLAPTSLNEKEEAQGLSLEDKEVRNRLATQGIQRLFKEKPFPLYDQSVVQRIATGNIADDLHQIADVDWVIEVVVEKLAIKQQLLAEIEKNWSEGTIVSSNTSGISLHKIVQDRSPAFQKHFLGTHFFNPPRYMKLLEIIPTQWTHPKNIQKITSLAETRLGKGVVLCKDTPNFIGNRIGTYGIQVILQAMEQMKLRPDAVDAITGRLLGRPKSATFRTLDLVGLDTYAHVVHNVHTELDNEIEKAVFQLPFYLEKMVEKGWLGQKSGQGFYLKKGKEIQVLDLTTEQYVSREKFSTPAMIAAKRAKTLPERLRTLLYAEDVAAQFSWKITKQMLLYSAELVSEIADHPLQIDQAMRWGFSWDLGPFEIWDAIGLKESVERMKREGERIPQWVDEWVASGHESFYFMENGKRMLAHPTEQKMNYPMHKKEINVDLYKKQGKVRKQNQAASLIDIGDDMAYLEFHPNKGAIGPDLIALMQKAVHEVDQNFAGLVIGSHAPHFCVGANILLMLMEAQDGNWIEIDMMIRQFQQTMGSLRRLEKPVVVAPYGRTLGGGVEVCLPADHVQASAETYIGLVETGVGLIPAGGGCKEMLYRTTAHLHDATARQEAVNRLFQQIALARVSTSAVEARNLGYLRESDGITYQADHLLADAKQHALALSRLTYQVPELGKLRVVGERGYAVLKMALYDFRLAGKITEHDYVVAEKLAYVLSGGNVPEGTEVTEDYLLNLEREAFLSLIGEPKTQARMQYMLSKGKPLRN